MAVSVSAAVPVLRFVLATAMEGNFNNGIKFAEEFLRGEGHRELAGKQRAQVQRKA